MKAYILVSLGFLLLCCAFIPVDGWTGPPLGGEWLLNEETGEYWYLHSNAEFDLIGDGCRTCHPEMSRTRWNCGGGWWSEYEF